MKNNACSLDKSSGARFKVLILGGVACLFALAIVACLLGAANISFIQILKVLFAQDNSADVNCIIWDIRIPRIFLGIIVGASFAVSGAVMQAVTQNPLASPSLAGLSAGSTLGLLIAMVLIPGMTLEAGMIASTAGSAVGVTLVFVVSMLARNNNSPAGLAISGLIVSMFLSSITSAILHATNSGYELSFWTIGGLSASRWPHVNVVLPFFISAFILVMSLSPSLTALALGSETATGLGVKVPRIRAAALICVFVLVGSSVAVAGPIGFIGLMVPHIAKKIVGLNYTRVIAASAVLGAILLLVSDTLARYLTQGSLSAGVFTTLVGSVFFIYLALNSGRNKKAKLKVENG